MSDKAILTVKEMGELLDIGTNAAYALIHSNAFPVIKIGHAYRIPKEPFFAWLNRTESGDPQAVDNKSLLA